VSVEAWARRLAAFVQDCVAQVLGIVIVLEDFEASFSFQMRAEFFVDPFETSGGVDGVVGM